MQMSEITRNLLEKSLDKLRRDRDSVTQRYAEIMADAEAAKTDLDAIDRAINAVERDLEPVKVAVQG